MVRAEEHLSHHLSLILKFDVTLASLSITIIITMTITNIILADLRARAGPGQHHE
jgi:hypothetical protein